MGRGEDMAEGLSIVHDALEAYCDCDEAMVLAHLNRLENGPAAAAMAYLLGCLEVAFRDPEDDPQLAPLLSRGRLRDRLAGIEADIAENTAAAIIHDAMTREGVI